MIEILQTHQGLSLSIDENISKIGSRQDLIETLASSCQIQVEDLICMTRDGEQLTDEVFDQLQENEERGLSSSKTPENHPTVLFIFDRQYLYADLDMLARELEEQPALELVIEEAEYTHPPTPRGLSSLLHWCSSTLEHMRIHNRRSEQYFAQLRIIDEGTKVALKNLLSHAGSVKVGFQELQNSAEDELAKMGDLLKGHATDLRILSLVPINNKLLPESKGRSKERVLSDYVSPTKMGAVYDACSNVYDELQAAMSTLRSNGLQLTDDTDGLRSEVQSTSVDPSSETLQESTQALLRAQELADFLHRNCAPDEHGWPAAQRLSQSVDTLRAVEEAAGELVLLDEVCRESLRRLCADRNDMIARSLHLLSDISSLQSEYADLGIELSQFDAEIKSNRTDGFRHLLRLKNMLWAYGRSLIEIYRRQEFEKHFLHRSQALAELMANFTESERQRRLDFRSNTVGALPWEIKGMDESTPSLDISTGPTSSREDFVKLHKEDIDRLFVMLDAIKVQLDTPEGAEAIGNISTALRESLRRIEEAEQEFVQLVEQTLLEDEDVSDGEETGNSLATRRYKRERKGYEQDLQQLKIEYGEQVRSISQAHDRELLTLQAELSKAKSDLRHAEGLLEKEQGQSKHLRSALDAVQTELGEERSRGSQLSGQVERMRSEHERSRSSAKAAADRTAEKEEKISELEAHLRDVQLELTEVKAAHEDASKRVEALLSQGTSFEHELQVAQDRIDDLTRTLSEVRAEAREARDALSEAEQARDKTMRTHRAEADSDRAILEENLRTKSSDLQHAQSAIERLEAEISEHGLNAKNLRSQLTAADEAHGELVQQLEQTKEAMTEAEMSKRQTDRYLQATLQKSRALISRTILLSDALRRLPSLAGQTTKSGNKLVSEPSEKLDEASEKERQQSFEAFKLAGDAASVETVLDVLAWLTKASIEDAAIEKMELLTTLCKKWMKAYKHTNEKGQKQQLLLREKITFRSFNVGDLALFLPTRGNAVQDNAQGGAQTQVINFAKPWAAFNINYPHYFLNFDGKPENEQLRESLKQKEWIVARITKIESKIASSRSMDGNPFNLAEGVRFFLLDVENWNLATTAQPPGNPRRKSASTAVGPARSEQGQVAIPPLRRWESTPGEVAAIAELGPAGPAGEKIDVDATVTDETQSSSDEKKGSSPATNASNGSTRAPVDGVESHVEPPAVVSTSKPSGLSLALRQPLNAVPAATRGGPTYASAATSPDRGYSMGNDVNARWSTSVGSRNGQTPSSSIASDRYTPRLANSVTPAFGRAKRFARTHAGTHNGEEQNGSLTRSRASSPGQAVSERKSIIGVMLPSEGVSRLRSGDMDQTPNPFSSSPAPGVSDGMAAMNEAYARKESKGKGKGREVDEESSAEIRSDSRTSQTSSRRTPLSINSRSAALLSPRIRAPDQAKPTMETAQGLNSFGHAAYASEGSYSSAAVATSPQALASATSPMGSQPSASGFSLRSSTSAGSNVSASRPVAYDQRRTSSVSQKSGAIASPSPKRSSSFFGSGWTLGRKSGAQAAAASSSSQTKDDDEDLSATIVDARQSLRRLKESK